MFRREKLKYFLKVLKWKECLLFSVILILTFQIHEIYLFFYIITVISNNYFSKKKSTETWTVFQTSGSFVFKQISSTSIKNNKTIRKYSYKYLFYKLTMIVLIDHLRNLRTNWRSSLFLFRNCFYKSLYRIYNICQ